MSVDFEMDACQADIARIVEDVFRTMLNLEVVPGKTTRCSEPDFVTASVRFNGEWSGALLVQCSGSQACALTTCLMPDLIPSRVDDDVRDSIGELANMVGGNLKSLMPPGVALSLPSVVEGVANCHEVAETNAATTISFSSDLGVFWVTLAQRTDANDQIVIAETASHRQFVQ